MQAMKGFIEGWCVRTICNMHTYAATRKLEQKSLLRYLGFSDAAAAVHRKCR